MDAVSSLPIRNLFSVRLIRNISMSDLGFDHVIAGSWPGIDIPMVR